MGIFILIIYSNHYYYCLGIFLGDAGWLNESASVLSHTHVVITAKWINPDRNLQLLKRTQCLTKLKKTLNYT